MASGLAREVVRLAEQVLSRFCFRAKVVSATATSCTVLRYTGDDNIVCALAASYPTPVADDEVVVLYFGGGHIVLCKVLR